MSSDIASWFRFPWFILGWFCQGNNFLGFTTSTSVRTEPQATSAGRTGGKKKNSAQDRRTLSTAQCCLNSLRIRIEAQVNTVEDSQTATTVALTTAAEKKNRSFGSSLGSSFGSSFRFKISEAGYKRY